jgi:hypothetical protein
MRLARRKRTAPELLGVRRLGALLVEDHPLPPFVLDQEVELHSQRDHGVGELSDAGVIHVLALQPAVRGQRNTYRLGSSS